MITKTVQALLMSTIILLPTMAWSEGPRSPNNGLNHVKPLQNNKGFDKPESKRGNNNKIQKGGNAIADLATVAVIGGMTYYILDNVFYQKNNNNYVVVQTPPNYVANTNSADEPTKIDYQGKRYYVKDNRFYQRDLSGTFVEVPRPAGL